VKRPKLAWRDGEAVQESPPATPPPQPTPTDDDVFTVSGGKGKSPDVEPGVYRLVVTNVRKETGPNPFEPGTERTSYIFHLAIADAVEEGEFLWFAGTSLKSKRLTDMLAALKLSIATAFTKTQVVGRKCQGNVILSDKGYARLSQVFPAA
jgi:hypothetical protein